MLNGHVRKCVCVGLNAAVPLFVLLVCLLALTASVALSYGIKLKNCSGSFDVRMRAARGKQQNSTNLTFRASHGSYITDSVFGFGRQRKKSCGEIL